MCLDTPCPGVAPRTPPGPWEDCDAAWLASVTVCTTLKGCCPSGGAGHRGQWPWGEAGLG